MHDTFHGQGNLLLATIGSDDRALLAPHLTRYPVTRRQVLVSADTAIEHVWFLESGVASIVSMLGDQIQTEVGIFGREGFAGTPLLLGSEISPHEVFMQIEGDSGLRMDRAPFLAAVERSVTLRTTLLRYVQTMMIQAAHSTVSNAHQRIEARLARWLLMCHDRNAGDEIAVTHEFMAMMIGAERSGVTVSLHVLEGAGMIRSTRGRVIILDRRLLEELAGDTYGRAEAEYRRLIAPFGKTAPRSEVTEPD